MIIIYIALGIIGIVFGLLALLAYEFRFPMFIADHVKSKILVKNALITIFCIILIGCATTGEKVSGIQEGMNKDRVITQLGKPDGYQRSGEFETLIYSNRLVSGWSWDKGDYNVVLKNGKVVEYGATAIRPTNYTSQPMSASNPSSTQQQQSPQPQPFFYIDKKQYNITDQNGMDTGYRVKEK